MDNNNTIEQRYKALCEHILAMRDDAFLSGHPEFTAIVEEAETGKPGRYDGPAAEEGDAS